MAGLNNPSSGPAPLVRGEKVSAALTEQNEVESLVTGRLPSPEPAAQVDNTENALAAVSAAQKAKARDKVKGDLQAILTVREYDPHRLSPIATRVLEEEDYVDVLQEIIVRDFFPDLSRLRLQSQLLSAHGKGDFQAVGRITAELAGLLRRTSELKPPSSSSRSDSPTTHPAEPNDSVVTIPSSRKRVKLVDGREFDIDISRVGLSEFQCLFTSEDNASFEEIVRREKIKLSKEQQWIEACVIQHNLLNEETRLAIEKGERPNRLIYSNLEARNSLMFPITSGTVGVVEVHQTGSKRPYALGPGTFGAGVIIANQPPKASVSIKRSGTIDHSNTRIRDSKDEDGVGKSLLEEMREQQRRKIARIEKATIEETLFETMVIRGDYSATKIEQQRRLERLNGSSRQSYTIKDLIHLEGRGVQTSIKTPSHLGYDFVHTPSFDPETIPGSPLMTWGSIGATPVRLSDLGEDLPKTETKEKPERSNFVIPEAPSKEVAAHRLAELASSKLRAKKRKTMDFKELIRARTPLRGGTPTPGTSSADIFATPRLSGAQLLRKHSAMLTDIERTPGLGSSGLVAPRKLRRRNASLRGRDPGGTRKSQP